ncbi:MAG: M48 family metallopeptidase [Gammaproteobacteria bacterium]
MNFFEKQAQARRSTTWLVVLFTLAVVAIVAAIDFIVVLLFAGYDAQQPAADPVSLGPMIAAASLVTLTVIGISALYRTLRLRSGGRVVAESMGATPVPPDPKTLELQRLRNVVEEMSIASGVPVPALYVMENEAGINAFAAGYSPSDAVIAVTRGCLEQLDRDELQGVIAHEYSHVLNGDMRLNIRLMGLLFGIVSLTVLGRILARVRGGNRRGNQLAILGIGLIVIGGIGVFFARWIKAGVSRQREYLADASAVQFTRQTRGLAGALKKIAGYGEGSQLQHPDTEEVSHMLFASGLASRLFATHPPIDARIRLLDPAFTPQARRAARPAAAPEAAAAFAGGVQTPAAPAEPAPQAEPTRSVGALAPADAVTRSGELSAEQIRRAGAVREALPEALRAAAYDAATAPALLMALLLAEDDSARTAQLQRIEASHGAELRSRALQLLPALRALERPQRLPLAALSLPALRTLDRAEIRRLKGSVHALIHADAQVSVHEYALGAMLDTQLGDTLKPAAAGAGGTALSQRSHEAACVLTVLASVGHADAQAAAAAFRAGLQHALPGATAAYAPPQRWHEGLDAALRRLDQVRVEHKARLLEACVMTLQHDGVVSVDEYELLRSLCASLHCPLPLFR